MDQEAPIRREVLRLLGSVCDCVEEAPVRLRSGYAGRIDVLCRPRAVELCDLAFAIEVKAFPQLDDALLGQWLCQAVSYVGAKPIDWPPVSAVFVWLFGMPASTEPDDILRRDGMRMFAQHLRVGAAIEDSKAGLILVFGPSCEVYCARAGGWRPKARERLLAKRIDAGVRRGLITKEYE